MSTSLALRDMLHMEENRRRSGTSCHGSVDRPGSPFVSSAACHDRQEAWRGMVVGRVMRVLSFDRQVCVASRAAARAIQYKPKTFGYSFSVRV